MKKETDLRDDFIAVLLKRSSLESPSEEFMETVMGKIEAMPAYQPRRKSLYLIIKPLLPWILLPGVFIVFCLTYEFSFGTSSFGKDYLRDVIFPSVSFVVDSFIDLASSKFYSIALTVVICGGFLFGIERLISRRLSANHHYVI